CSRRREASSSDDDCVASGLVSAGKLSLIGRIMKEGGLGKRVALVIGLGIFLAVACSKKQETKPAPPSGVKACRARAGKIVSHDGKSCTVGPLWKCASAQPVCGCDNVTYKSYCDAANAGITAWTFGECKQAPTPPPIEPPPGTEVKLEGDSAEILYDTLK